MEKEREKNVPTDRTQWRTVLKFKVVCWNFILFVNWLVSRVCVRRINYLFIINERFDWVTKPKRYIFWTKIKRNFLIFFFIVFCFSLSFVHCLAQLWNAATHRSLCVHVQMHTHCQVRPNRIKNNSRLRLNEREKKHFDSDHLTNGIENFNYKIRQNFNLIWFGLILDFYGTQVAWEAALIDLANSILCLGRPVVNSTIFDLKALTDSRCHSHRPSNIDINRWEWIDVVAWLWCNKIIRKRHERMRCTMDE